MKKYSLMYTGVQRRKLYLMLNLSLNNQKKFKSLTLKSVLHHHNKTLLLWEHHIYEKGSQKPTEKYKSKT